MIFADVVRMIHYVFAFWLATSFLWGQSSRYMALFVIPFLFLHWFTNNDICALTMLECYLRGIDKCDSYVHGVVGPVYQRQFFGDPSRFYLGCLWATMMSYENPRLVYSEINKIFSIFKVNI